jgi:hypothetical protein
VVWKVWGILGVFVHWKNVVLLCDVLVGLVLVLYGANYYDALSGWTGVCLGVGGFLAEVILRVFRRVRKREVD